MINQAIIKGAAWYTDVCVDSYLEEVPAAAADRPDWLSGIQFATLAWDDVIEETALELSIGLRSEDREDTAEELRRGLMRRVESFIPTTNNPLKRGTRVNKPKQYTISIALQTTLDVESILEAVAFAERHLTTVIELKYDRQALVFNEETSIDFMADDHWTVFEGEWKEDFATSPASSTS